MKFGRRIIAFAIDRPKTILYMVIAVTLILGVMMIRVRVDTDPENMLSEDEAVRIFHHNTKETFNLHDVVVVGVVNEEDPDGVFNPSTLGHVHELTRFAMALADPEDPSRRVVTRDVIAPGNVDDIQQGGPGQVRFEWLMKSPPETREEALRIRDRALANPLLRGTMVSEDARAIAIYLPITQKDFAYSVSQALQEKISEFSGNDQFYITGLPVAEDTFGVEMFVQMAVSAPLAMLAIFFLMLLFFKKIKMIIPPMIIAMASVICTMGLLIGTGHTVHIMSSMIPIFLMPIAVVDSIHILSEFFDTYQTIRNRRKTLETVMGHLFMPMLYTSLTSSVGFASLALTPIPPVQVFGLFVALGIMLAWLLTIVFIPAYIMLLNEKSLETFGVIKAGGTPGGNDTFLGRLMCKLGAMTYAGSKLIIVVSVLVLGGAAYGISRIEINDNPVKWFHKTHDIRVADRVLNQHFGGTYEAYLILEDAAGELDLTGAGALVQTALKDAVGSDLPVYSEASALTAATLAGSKTPQEFLTRLSERFDEKIDAAADAAYDAWADAGDALEQVRNRGQIFNRPECHRHRHRVYTASPGASG